MESGRSLRIRPCLCNLCKGNSRLSNFKVKQHVKLYGLWFSKDSNDHAAAAKKVKVDVDSSASDSDQESAADDNMMCIAEDHAVVEDECYRLQEEDEISSDSGLPQVHFKYGWCSGSGGVVS